MSEQRAIGGSQTTIHPSSIVEPGARLGIGVRVGPFCHVTAEVVLGDGVELVSHISVQGRTTIGANTRIWPQATLGAQPQNIRHKGGQTELVIGSGCIIRENVTAHVGSDTGHGKTVIGDNCFLLAYSHVAHDCTLGNNVTMVNCATLAGHCEVGEFATIGGLSAVHQFVRIGHHAFIGGCTALNGDLIPYGMAIGNRAVLRGLNIIGMKRSGLPKTEILALRRAYTMLFGSNGTIADNASAVRAEFTDNPAVIEIVDFLTDRGKRHFCVPKRGTATDHEGEDFE